MKNWRFIRNFVFLGSLLFSAGLFAQDTASEPTKPPEQAVSGEEKVKAPSLESLRSSLTEIESDANLEDVVKETLLKRYQEAVEAAEQTLSFQKLDEEFTKALKTGPEEVKQLEAELKEAKEAPPAPPLESSLAQEEVEKQLAEIQRERAALVAELDEWKEQVTELEGRPEAIPAELTEAKEQLKEVRTDLESTEPAEDLSTKATIARLESQFAATEAKIAMLEKEQLSAEIRTTRATLTRDLRAEKANRLDEQIEALQAKAADQLTRDIREAKRVLQKTSGEKTAEGSTEVSPAGELENLIEELQSVSELLKTAKKEAEERTAMQEEIVENYNTISTQFEKGVDSKSLSPLLHENLNNLPHPWESSLRLRSIHTRISNARSGLFGVRQGNVPESKAKASAEKDKGEDSRSELEIVVDRIRGDLVSTYEKLIQELKDIEATERDMREVSEEFRDYAESKLFSVRSSTAITPGSLAHFPEALAPALGLEHFAGLGSLLKKIPVFGWVILVLLVALSIGIYLLLARWLRNLGIRTRHYSTETYRQTIPALILTFLLATPIPVVLATIGFGIAIQPGSQEWAPVFGAALIATAKVLFPILFLLEVCRKQGLAEAHFRWDTDILAKLRRFCFGLLPVAFITSMAITIASNAVDSNSTATPFGEPERIPLLLLVIGGGFLLARILNPKTGIAAISFRDAPDSLFGKLRFVWYWWVVGGIVVLTALLLIGFVYTVLQLSERIVLSLWNVVVAFVIYEMLLRWVTIREHKAARQKLEDQHIERTRLALEKQDSGEKVSEIVTNEEGESEEEIDLGTVREQTRRFMAFFSGLWLLWMLHSLWGEFGPLANTVGKIEAIGPFSVGEILYAIVVIAILVSTIRNLPGILEVLVFQRTRLDDGTKTAVISLANYAAIAIAAVMIFRNLGVDWSQFGWIAAALSVGLGFGLQEVVANFVSGIILLFERPIRVGDVVTVDGVDGKVSRIQIRATTILDWDRKELIVPNKRFITGTLKNWTRSNSINRVVIPVGVAYGTDTVRAREILLKVAEKHPEIMEDPGPVAAFEGFGDSTLNLVLRAYLPNLDNRLGVITELHTRIDEEFSKAGIEIAFPQMDVHFTEQKPKGNGVS